MSFNSHHSPSESHITLVDKVIGPNTNPGLTSSPCHASKKLWIDRILGLFCAKSFVNNEGALTQTCETTDVGGSLSSWSSPWILPVHVVSNQQDEEKHCITKLAKCTIDTGNLQGNIVSRDFAEKVLGFPSSSFGEFTKEEEIGGTSITGEQHIPLGVIHLTWYHNNSTRVFRDMRFLVSPAPHCDLIIGAWSIQKDRILGVPCLTLTRPSDTLILPNPPRHKGDKDLVELERIDGNVRGAWDTARNKRNECDQGTEKWTKFDQAFAKRSNEVDVVGWLIRICDIGIAIKKEHSTDTSEVDEVWNEINERWGDVRLETRKDVNPEYNKLLEIKELGLVDGRLGK